MSTKNMNTRIVNKHDIEANWLKATTFIPMQGEIIIYDIEVDENGNTLELPEGRTTPYKDERFKIGDGKKLVEDLPFIGHSDADLKLSEQFTITKDFGYYKLDGAASKKVGTVGQSLHSFLQGAFASEDTTVFSTSPSCSISMSGASGEVGDTVIPSASWSTNSGTYKWGTYANNTANYSTKTTGIVYKDINGNSLGSEDISLSSTSVILGDESVTVTASGTVKRSAVTNHPCSNLGNDIYDDYLNDEYKSEKILTPSKPATFTGYRKMFMGVVAGDAEINSETIRGLDLISKEESTTAQTFTAPVGTEKIVVAYRADYQTKLPKFELKTMTWGVFNDFEIMDSTVPVADKRGTKEDGTLYNPTAYTVCTYTPVSPLGAPTEFRVTLGGGQ